MDRTLMKYGSAEFWMSTSVENARWKVSASEKCERNPRNRMGQLIMNEK